MKETNNIETFINNLNLNSSDKATVEYALKINNEETTKYLSELNESYNVFFNFIRTNLIEKTQKTISKYVNKSKSEEQIFKEKIDYSKSKNKWQTEILNKIVDSSVKGTYDTADSLLNFIDATKDETKRTVLRRELGKFLKDAGVQKTKIYDKISKSMITIYFINPL